MDIGHHLAHAPSMLTLRVDRDEYEKVIGELLGREERRDGDVVTISGLHEDHGHTVLRREVGVFTISAEDITHVRPWGVSVPRRPEQT